jgi:hypothetical protein
MKKAVVLIFLISCLSLASQAQVYPYIEDFEAMSPYTAPAGWITSIAGFQVYPIHGTSSSKGLEKQLTNFNLNDSTTSPLIGLVGTNAELKFDYRVCETSLYPNFPITFTAGDKIEVKIVSGTSVTTVLTIDQSNHITSVNFATKTVSLATFAGQNINLRLKVTKASSTFDCFMDFDNISINSLTGISENSYELKPVLFPSTITGNQSINLKGVENGDYTISVLNSNGSLVSNFNQAINTLNTNINFDKQLKAGFYLLKIESEKKSHTLKFKVK